VGSSDGGGTEGRGGGGSARRGIPSVIKNCSVDWEVSKMEDVKAYCSYFTLSPNFVSLMLKYPNGILDIAPDEMFLFSKLYDEVKKRNKSLKDELFLRIATPTVVSVTSGQLQKTLAGLDVLFAAQQSKRLSQMLDSFQRADKEESLKIFDENATRRRMEVLFLFAKHFFVYYLLFILLADYYYINIYILAVAQRSRCEREAVGFFRRSR